jgi:hypothetical protein
MRPYFLGTTPDLRGAKSFYEAIYNLFARREVLNHLFFRK